MLLCRESSYKKLCLTKVTDMTLNFLPINFLLFNNTDENLQVW